MMVKSGSKPSVSASVSGRMNMFLAKWCCQASSVMMRTFFLDLGLVPQYPSKTYLFCCWGGPCTRACVSLDEDYYVALVEFVFVVTMLMFGVDAARNSFTEQCRAIGGRDRPSAPAVRYSCAPRHSEQTEEQASTEQKDAERFLNPASSSGLEARRTNTSRHESGLQKRCIRVFYTPDS